MKNTIAKASSSVDELSKRTELTEERSVNTHTDQNSEKEQVGPERRGERSPGTRGAPAEGLTHVLRVPQGEAGEDWVPRMRNGGGNFPKCGKRRNSLQTPGRKKTRETDTKTHHVKLVKTKDAENYLGSSDGKTPPYL